MGTEVDWQDQRRGRNDEAHGRGDHDNQLDRDR